MRRWGIHGVCIGPRRPPAGLFLMNMLTTHLDDLLTVLRASANLPPDTLAPDRVRGELADQLDTLAPGLADRVRRLDEWHAETLSEFMAEAHLLAELFDIAPPGDGEGDTHVD